METLIERTLYAARWLLEPVYLGLRLALLLLSQLEEHDQLAQH